MGGRGSSSSVGAGGKNSADYKSAYETEMSNANDFAGSFALDSGATKSSIGYQMHAYKSATGQSLIAETNREITFLRGELREANAMGKSYGMSQNSINGMKAGIKEKIVIREKAVAKMQESRSEYERFASEARTGNAKAKRRGGRWM